MNDLGKSGTWEFEFENAITRNNSYEMCDFDDVDFARA